ncbi:bifunctional diaminohydroxyphosphoribosylaminopyrimidine deaminase/5-amino-6-(5-phosphoribosylamino)uracil reductase RibD [Shinella daejeonensis]|uniref:bifunctional diaminohydroxyphosphoribosylaminopyrimidine deaminase/5-amino-6-(5-phosphoribosylamino)uracil reductase RibD n=1 Tax=Shinella daejeonensis TaxID=659017 RepID=UPI0020C76521|nr:bifunctional diaminohydroxyphosphoribosylaminopyrimidine deaminase/5-amino-6-(5-phosphoribosylamino)uracil reductase RibD [Shinella daejeonensis]MCP8895643.1 bifunctional diaminohydroxyphosphoribosylaminopyrimidine deaminase/5-amino-6-(5-phosphoribosylamino)uracil reductase RibD [Shinella daejeonensis]
MPAAGEDARFMAAALRLGRRNLGLTATNPSVACLIVRDGVVLASAVTAPGGRPHAETQALAEAGAAARGATAYVTLEPCSHHGKTPPCAEALVAAGIARVVVSVTDPDERVAGRGLSILENAGIVVRTGVLEAEGRDALAAYLIRQTRKRPHVTLKLAVSADGMIGRAGTGQVAITGPVSRGQVHVLRAETDAILVGIGTALADDPELTCRLPGLQDRSPARIVLDPRLELSPASRLARTAKDVPVMVVTTEAQDGLVGDVDPGTRAARAAALEAMGVEILRCDPRRLDDLLMALATRGMSSLLVEGGARTAGSFLDAGLVDRILLFTGPVVLGKDGIESPCVSGRMPEGFTLRRTAGYGADNLEEYERGDGCLRA